jgi:hypothetical protein
MTATVQEVPAHLARHLTWEDTEMTYRIITDASGAQWLFKPAAKAFRADAEHAAARLGALWGFRTPESRIITDAGQYGQAQRVIDAIGTLEYDHDLGWYDVAPVPWSSLTAQQACDIACEHVLDWALDNDDSRASNYLRTPDGRITGIDKGRALVSFGHWEGLAADKRADERSAMVSTSLYNAMRSHAISQEVADIAYRAVMTCAARVQASSDVTVAGIVREGIAARATFGAPGSAEGLVSAVLARKARLTQDFSALYSRVYAQAGWTLPVTAVSIT